MEQHTSHEHQAQHPHHGSQEHHEHLRDIKAGKIFAMISYWGPLCITPFIFKKHNKFAAFHGKQGLVLFIFFVIGLIFSPIPWLGETFFRTIGFIYLLLMLWGTIQALIGSFSRIPIVAHIADKISL